jgi:hypothetical protein
MGSAEGKAFSGMTSLMNDNTIIGRPSGHAGNMWSLPYEERKSLIQ